MLPEEKARVKIDKQLREAGWDIVSRDEFVPNQALAVREALMRGNKESDYLLFVDGKAIAVVEAKKEENDLGSAVAAQAENYCHTPQSWYGLWFHEQSLIPLAYLANGNKIYYKNLLDPDSNYVELNAMHSPKKMLKLVAKSSEYGALPRIEKKGLRDCQYNAEVALENTLKDEKKKSLAVLATGSGKTYLACLASYRLLEYTSTRRVLFLVDRNNLARQTENEFNTFNRTESKQTMNNLYQINRLKKPEDIKGDIIISTIQKLFAVLTGQQITDTDEDEEDDNLKKLVDNDDEPAVELGDDLKLPSDYFQFIVIDECHRSIYGKWKAVLDYFKDAKILGLTATPTPEAYAFFNQNTIVEYTYEESVVDGVNVPSRVYRIATKISTEGGSVEGGKVVNIKSRKTGLVTPFEISNRFDYTPGQLDRSVINRTQIEAVITAYRDSIYTDLYPEREENWNYIPKTLIFAKNDNHASLIVEVVKEIFAEKFADEKVPEKFVQKITYSSGNSNDLIRDLRIEKDFRIAVTVTLVATGTDVRPLEAVLFMNDVQSEVLYTQMKGRGCRTISADKLKEVTPNASIKECFYIIDAVGVTEHDKKLPYPSKPGAPTQRVYTLEQLLEHLAHMDVSDENLALLRDYCSIINKRYEESSIFSKHLDDFINEFGFAPKTLASKINTALQKGTLPEFISPSEDNSARMALISCLMNDVKARNKLLEMQKGYYVIDPEKDKVLYSGFSKETAKSFVETFEKYITEHKDEIEALRIIYNSEDSVITHSMLVDLRDKLLSENHAFSAYNIWKNYKLIDDDGYVDDFDVKQNINALTNLIQIVRYAFRKNHNLTSLYNGYASRFTLYCGQNQRMLTQDQQNVMKQIADYIVGEGAITIQELNSVDTDLWRKTMIAFNKDLSVITSEIITLSKFLLKAA